MNIKRYSVKRVFRNPSDGDGDSGGALSLHGAGDAFAALDNGGSEEESEESAAERLARDDLAGVTQQTAETNDEAANQAEDETITIKVDGKDVEIKKSELPELYKGGLREKDYTQKTMAAADARKAAEAETAKARQERDNYASQLNNFAILTSNQLAEQQKQLTQELLDTDPIEYLRQERIFKERQAELSNAQAEIQRLQGEYQQEQQAEAQQFLRDQHAALLKAFPDWKDAEKMQKHIGVLEGYMGKAGFSEKDGRLALDARVLTMADKAQKYDALMERAKGAANKVTAAPVKVERPGVTQVQATDGRTAAMKKLEKSGDLRDAGAVFANFV